MSLIDLISTENGKSTLCVVTLDDLHQFHEAIVQDALSKQELAIKAKADEEFLTPAEACKMLSVSRTTLDRWKNVSYLVPSRLGGQCRYKRSEIEAILNAK